MKKKKSALELTGSIMATLAYTELEDQIWNNNLKELLPMEYPVRSTPLKLLTSGSQACKVLFHDV